MKKKILTLSLVWTCLFLLTVSSSAQESPPKFNFKLSGGYGKVVGGDLPQVIEDINQLAMDQAARTGASVTRSWIMRNGALNSNSSSSIISTKDSGSALG